MVPVYLDVRWGRGDAADNEQESRLRVSTGHSCHPSNWNEERQRLRSTEKGYAKANNKLAELERTAGLLIGQAELNQVLLTPEQLLADLKPKRPAKAHRAGRPTSWK
ncbi:Arm DNA-binding domain-containing protein [Hymenobacter aerilatus]|uniref:Arm DNA-binding domain-containing protein n=1 Tax=Hymenobacter aerilatus TaxID=2932251 RepID=A0A8T9SXC7_9BACT|nr:Arm DNA-binding domain-containing protein [Hymenobacter aerilatus]UOR06882.1 Arm DNA-binding domain-containing protein [Hymenobacter aerilatus]